MTGCAAKIRSYDQVHYIGGPQIRSNRLLKCAEASFFGICPDTLAQIWSFDRVARWFFDLIGPGRLVVFWACRLFLRSLGLAGLLVWSGVLGASASFSGREVLWFAAELSAVLYRHRREFGSGKRSCFLNSAWRFAHPSLRRKLRSPRARRICSETFPKS